MMPMQAMSSDSIRLSLLTCAPGTEIYALFGHSAIRYEHPALQRDWVFNYGMFSFSEPNFVMRFVKGETDEELEKIFSVNILKIVVSINPIGWQIVFL